MATYHAEEQALSRAYRKAVGWALQYGIKTYYETPGYPPKALGDLRAEIDAYEAAHDAERIIADAKAHMARQAALDAFAPRLDASSETIDRRRWRY